MLSKGELSQVQDDDSARDHDLFNRVLEVLNGSRGPARPSAPRWSAGMPGETEPRAGPTMNSLPYLSASSFSVVTAAANPFGRSGR
jgi:hypothetical protein